MRIGEVPRLPRGCKSLPQRRSRPDQRGPLRTLRVVAGVTSVSPNSGSPNPRDASHGDVHPEIWLPRGYEVFSVDNITLECGGDAVVMVLSLSPSEL